MKQHLSSPRNNDKVHECAINLLNELKDIIYQSSMKNIEEKNLLLGNILDKIYSNDDQKQIAQEITIPVFSKLIFCYSVNNLY